MEHKTSGVCTFPRQEQLSSHLACETRQHSGSQDPNPTRAYFTDACRARLLELVRVRAETRVEPRAEHVQHVRGREVAPRVRPRCELAVHRRQRRQGVLGTRLPRARVIFSVACTVNRRSTYAWIRAWPAAL